MKLYKHTRSTLNKLPKEYKKWVMYVDDENLNFKCYFFHSNILCWKPYD